MTARHREWNTAHPEVEGLPKSILPHAGVFTSARPVDRKWASRRMAQMAFWEASFGALSVWSATRRMVRRAGMFRITPVKSRSSQLDRERSFHVLARRTSIGAHLVRANARHCAPSDAADSKKPRERGLRRPRRGRRARSHFEPDSQAVAIWAVRRWLARARVPATSSSPRSRAGACVFRPGRGGAGPAERSLEARRQLHVQGLPDRRRPGMPRSDRFNLPVLFAPERFLFRRSCSRSTASSPARTRRTTCASARATPIRGGRSGTSYCGRRDRHRRCRERAHVALSGRTNARGSPAFPARRLHVFARKGGGASSGARPLSGRRCIPHRFGCRSVTRSAITARPSSIAHITVRSKPCGP
jgi:hypothetical protein